MSTEEKLILELDLAEIKAWDSLSRYKFQMFGYWAAIWVHLNRLTGQRRKNPWRSLVTAAKAHLRHPPQAQAAVNEGSLTTKHI